MICRAGPNDEGLSWPREATGRRKRRAWSFARLWTIGAALRRCGAVDGTMEQPCGVGALTFTLMRTLLTDERRRRSERQHGGVERRAFETANHPTMDAAVRPFADTST